MGCFQFFVAFLVLANTYPVEIGLVLQILQTIEHSSHVLTGAVAGQQEKLLPQLGVIERLLRRSLEVGDRAGEHASVVESDGDGRGKRGRTLLGDGNRYARRERADLRVAQGRLVEGAWVARIADMRQRDAERDRI